MIRTLTECEKLLFGELAHIGHLNEVRIVVGTILNKILLFIARMFIPEVEAITVANYVFMPEVPQNPWAVSLLAHECVHVDQFLTNPAKFMFMYLWDTITRGYERNRAEIEAYAVSDTVYNILTVKSPEVYQYFKENNKKALAVSLLKIRR